MMSVSTRPTCTRFSILNGGYVSTRPTCIHVPGFQSSIGRGGGGGGMWCFPSKILKFSHSEVASGGFWGHRRLVTEMLLYVDMKPCL